MDAKSELYGCYVNSYDESTVQKKTLENPRSYHFAFQKQAVDMTRNVR